MAVSSSGFKTDLAVAANIISTVPSPSGSFLGSDHCAPLRSAISTIARNATLVFRLGKMVPRQPVSQYSDLLDKPGVKLDSSECGCGRVDRRIRRVDSARSKKHLGLDTQDPCRNHDDVIKPEILHVP